MRRILPIILIICLVLGCFAGCSTEKAPYVPTGDGLFDPNATTTTAPPESQEQQLDLAYYKDLGLNPYQVANYTNRTLFPLLYQGLFVVDRNYTVYPVLCKNYKVSKDMKTYTFYPENATFPDGSVLTAQDVAASLLAAKAGPVYTGRLKAVVAVEVTEDGGVAVYLNTPYENLPILLDIPIVKEAQVSESFPQGTGAYSLGSGMEGQGLLRRSDWWCQGNLQVTASYIPLREVASTGDVRDAFEFGDVGLVCTDPGSDDYVDYRSDHEVWEAENGIFLYLACNEESPVFSHVEIRQALTYAIDRATLAESYYRGFASPAYLPASPSSPYYHKGLASKYGFDPVKLVQAVENTQPEETSLVLLVNKNDSRRVRAARAIAKMLSDCGLKVILSELPVDAYRQALRQGAYDLHLGQTILSPNMDLSAFFDPMGALSYGGLSDAAIFALCKESMANTGNYYTLYKAILEDAMLCPVLVRSYAIYAERGLLSGIQPARDQALYYTIGKTLADAQIPQ